MIDERLKFIDNMGIGDVFTREQLMAIFKISGQSGMMKSNTVNCLVLTTSLSNGVYEDSIIDNGTLIYTGEGLHGNKIKIIKLCIILMKLIFQFTYLLRIIIESIHLREKRSCMIGHIKHQKKI